MNSSELEKDNITEDVKNLFKEVSVTADHI